ncbi:MAG: PAS domain-containing sensor histidine kinase [Alphaproteobacteria bacterium]|nr:PAS domain-containing sensor histidine kinase [Alphaproteobacteria bacterium]
MGDAALRPIVRLLGVAVTREDLSRWAPFALVGLAIAASIANYVVLTGAAPLGPSPLNTQILLYANIGVLIVLGIFVARRLVRVLRQRRQGLAGSRLHVRLVILFGLVAAIPAVAMALFSAVFLSLGMESWFSERVRTVLFEADAVARGYLDEKRQDMTRDALAIATDVSREGWLLYRNVPVLTEILARQAGQRRVNAAVVIDGSGRSLARYGYYYVLDDEEVLRPSIMERARKGELVVLSSADDDRVRALVKLDGFEDAYLYVARFVDTRLIGHIERTQGAKQQYAELEEMRGGLQFAFGAGFAALALVLLLAAVWMGLTIANALSRPVSLLIEAADAVGKGDLNARVPERQSDDELGLLSRAFNRMTAQLEAQRGDLVKANRELDDRRRFTEAVLGGVSAGVIGLDPEGRVELPNRLALELVGQAVGAVVGRPLADVIPEFAPILEGAQRRPDRVSEGQVRLTQGIRTRTLLVRAVAEIGSDRGLQGFVVTFDDITELASAQRKAAWADVARRIAHEIKNPLTPIQLSAERLKRKYLSEINSDRDTFVQCTDTIVRQVGDIGRMVDEFSAFARMPAPQLKSEDAVRICRESLFLQQSARPQIRISSDLPAGPVPLHCDARQIGQAITNLLQNAVDAIEGRSPQAPADGEASSSPPSRLSLPDGEVVLSLSADEESVTIAVVDNGKGLPVEERDRLTEPYVTTRAKGTGLGLAIVKKIMEDHGGALHLEDRTDGPGARVRMVLPRDAAARDARASRAGAAAA